MSCRISLLRPEAIEEITELEEKDWTILGRKGP